MHKPTLRTQAKTQIFLHVLFCLTCDHLRYKHGRLSYLEDIDLVSATVVLEIVQLHRPLELNAAGVERFHRVPSLWLKIVAGKSKLRVQAQGSVVGLVQGSLHGKDTRIRSKRLNYKIGLLYSKLCQWLSFLQQLPLASHGSG